MWNKRYPEHQVDYIFNWSPKDWRGSTPTYNLKDQTYSKGAAKLPYLVELARFENTDMDNTVVSCNGVISFDNKSLEKNIGEFTLSELVKKRKSENSTPDESIQLSTEEIAGNKAVGVAKKSAKGKKNTDTPVVKKKDVKPPKKRVNPRDIGI